MTKLFNYDPYFDDFDEDKNFMRVLFRPGYSLQARELTQLQTILSNQIEKFGNHIFKSGSPIVGGKISLDDRAYYLILKTQYSGQDIVLESFLNKTIVSYNSTKTARAKVIAIDNSSVTPILVVKYLSGEFLEEGDELKIYGQNIFAELSDTDATGRSYVASIQDGVYYFKGQFVKVNPQFLVLETYYRLGLNTTTINKQPSYRIGIEFEELVIDEIDDVTLLDPAQGSFNYQAPGANRYKVNTLLSKRTLDSADESSFFEVIRIVNGVKTKEIDYPIYFRNVAPEKLPKEGAKVSLWATNLSQSINPGWVIILTPLIVAFFTFLRRRKKEPSTPTKIAFGLLISALSVLVMIAAVNIGGNGSEKVTVWWLVANYGIITIGELFLSPMGLSIVSKLSPTNITSLMMGGWFLSTSIGNKLSGVLASLWDTYDDKANFFWINFILLMFATLLMFILLKQLNRVMKEKGIN